MVSTRGVRYKFSEGERVLCYEPDPTKAKVLYDSKVLEVIENKDKRGRRTIEYLIHFQGWNSSWDRCVGEDFVLKDTEENRQLQRDLAEKAQLQLGAYLYRRERKKGSTTGSAGSSAAKRSRHRFSDDGSSSSTQPDEPENEEVRGGEPEPDAENSQESPEEEIKEEVESDSSESSENEPRAQAGSPPEHLPAPVGRAHLTMPAVLRDRLTFDYHLIVKRNRLTRLPASPCAAQILESFVKWFARAGAWHTPRCRNEPPQKPDLADVSRRLNLVREVADGMRVYFDFIMRGNLLYKPELAQYHQVCGQFLDQQERKMKEELESDGMSQDEYEDDIASAEEDIKSPKIPEYSHLPPDPIQGKKNSNAPDTQNGDMMEVNHIKQEIKEEPEDVEEDSEMTEEIDSELQEEMQEAMHQEMQEGMNQEELPDDEEMQQHIKEEMEDQEEYQDELQEDDDQEEESQEDLQHEEIQEEMEDDVSNEIQEELIQVIKQEIEEEIQEVIREEYEEMSQEKEEEDKENEEEENEKEEAENEKEKEENEKEEAENEKEEEEKENVEEEKEKEEEEKEKEEEVIEKEQKKGDIPEVKVKTEVEEQEMKEIKHNKKVKVEEAAIKIKQEKEESYDSQNSQAVHEPEKESEHKPDEDVQCPNEMEEEEDTLSQAVEPPYVAVDHSHEIHHSREGLRSQTLESHHIRESLRSHVSEGHHTREGLRSQSMEGHHHHTREGLRSQSMEGHHSPRSPIVEDSFANTVRRELHRPNTRSRRGNNSPVIERGNNSPSVQRGNNSPIVQRGNKSPNIQRGNISPSVQRGNNSPSVHRGNNSPSVHRGNNSPCVQIGTNSPSVQAGNNSPAIEDFPDRVEDPHSFANAIRNQINRPATRGQRRRWNNSPPTIEEAPSSSAASTVEAPLIAEIKQEPDVEANRPATRIRTRSGNRKSTNSNSPAINSPSVNSPATDSPMVDSPAINSPAVNSPAVDSPAMNSSEEGPQCPVATEEVPHLIKQEVEIKQEPRDPETSRPATRSGNVARRLRSHKSAVSQSENEEPQPSTSTAEPRNFEHSSSVGSGSGSSNEEWSKPAEPAAPSTSTRTPLSLLLDKVSKYEIIPREGTEHLPCRVYGAIHLARLFVRLPDFLNATQMSDFKLKLVVKHIDMFIQYLVEHKEWFGEKFYYCDSMSRST